MSFYSSARNTCCPRTCWAAALDGLPKTKRVHRRKRNRKEKWWGSRNSAWEEVLGFVNSFFLFTNPEWALWSRFSNSVFSFLSACFYGLCSVQQLRGRQRGSARWAPRSHAVACLWSRVREGWVITRAWAEVTLCHIPKWDHTYPPWANRS